MAGPTLQQDDAGNIWDVSSGTPQFVRGPQSAAQPNVVIPAAPPEPKFVPDHPNLIYTPGGGVTPLPGVPDKPQPPAFVPNHPNLVVTTGPNGQPAATPLPGVPGEGPQLDASQRAKAIQQLSYAQQLQSTIDELTKLYNAGPGSTHGIQGLKDYLPLPQNKIFDTKANAARGIVGQALGFTGGQLNTEREAEKAVGPYLPQSSDYDSNILGKFKTLQDLADNARQNAIQTLGGVPDANGIVHPETVDKTPPLMNTGQDQGAQFSLSNGKTQTVIDPALKATGQRLGMMVSSGASKADIYKFLQDSGVNPANTNIDEVLQQRDSPEGRRLLRANPGKPWTIGPEFYTKDVPMSGARAGVDALATSAPGAFLASAANGITGGYLDNLTDNPEMARTGMQLLRAEHPTASFAGDLAGYATDEALLGRIPGAQKLLATKLGRSGADAAYGTFSGSGENDQDRLTGALAGGVINTAGGMFGRGLQRGTGAALTGIRNADLSYLNSAGIPLTVGRIARGAGDFNPLNPASAGDELGKGVAGIEDRLAGLPGLDAVIGTARQRGDQAFNQAAFREIAPGVSGTGTEGLTSAKAAEQAAYAKIAPARLAVDPTFAGELDTIANSAKGLNHHAGDVATVINDIRSQIDNGELSGKGYQTAMQAIRKTRATLNDDVGGKATEALNQLEQTVAGLGDRQGGTLAQDLAAANAIHARRETVKSALRTGPSQGSGEMFSPKSLNQAAIGNTNRFGGLERALSPDRPFYDLTSAGMKVMPNLTPDSGTAGRLLLYPLIAGTGGGAIGAATDSDRAGGAERGAQIGTGLGLLTLGLGAGPYSRTGQKFLQKALLSERPAAVQKIGQFLRNNPKAAGMFGSTLLRDYFLQPELPQ
jgi:hypothetical protein